MFDYSLLKVMHRHGEDWEPLESLDVRAGDHHDAAAHDPERAAKAWVRRFRCRKCGEEFAMGTGDPEEPR